MSIFPKIQSPCPYKGALSEILDGETCRLCKREVTDLMSFTDQERVAFLESCSEEVCVSYTFPLRTAAAAMIAATALATPMSASAQDFEVEEQVIVVGGIKDRTNIEYVSDDDAALPELPVVYADDSAATGESAQEANEAAASIPASDLNHSIETQ